MVAVSTGLLRGMPQDEVEAVLAHEVSHVANGDMVTLTLIQGVVNTFVIFLSRIVGHFVDRVVLRNEHGYGIGYFLSVLAAQALLGVLASIVVMWVSRQREFRADAGSASLNGREPMIRALARLDRGQPGELPEALRAFGISGGKRVSQLFMSHPPIADRIAALQARLHWWGAVPDISIARPSRSLRPHLIAWLAHDARAAQCDVDDGVVLQVLGSGGPIADDGRASSGYLLWKDGQARVLIDTGGGIFLRFGEAGPGWPI